MAKRTTNKYQRDWKFVSRTIIDVEANKIKNKYNLILFSNFKINKNKILKPKVSKKEKGAIGITKFNKFLIKINKLFSLSFIFKPSHDWYIFFKLIISWSGFLKLLKGEKGSPNSIFLLMVKE